MGDIAKSLLTGAWTLVVGWILPTALNLAVFFLTVAPSLPRTGTIGHARHAMTTNSGLILLASSVLLGLALNAVQNPLYRVLEGYLLWPHWASDRRCKRHWQSRQDLQYRLRLIRLERQTRLSPGEAVALRCLHLNRRIKRAAAKDRRRTSGQRSNIYRALLRERRDRYPANEEQIQPTLLGNATRRFEVYGQDRFHLDSQLLWHELSSAAPDHTQRQVDVARANVDFFIALVYGHLAIAAAALGTLASERANHPLLLVTAATLTAAACVWYRAAVSATDEWAAAVRALVNVGRKPLAESLGLVLPQSLAAERRMWDLVNERSRLPYNEQKQPENLDEYRSPSGKPASWSPAAMWRRWRTASR